MTASSLLSFLAVPIRHHGELLGAIYVDEKDGEFTQEDEETLLLFASQAAMVIANARRHREERRARADLETLIETSPVGVVVFDARDGPAGVLQPGGPPDRGQPVEPGPDRGGTAGRGVLPAGRRSGRFRCGSTPWPRN